MTRQITIRLDDYLVDFMDAHTDNRTAYVAEALERERRRRMAEEDIIALSIVPAGVKDELAAITAAAMPEDPDIRIDATNNPRPNRQNSPGPDAHS